MSKLKESQYQLMPWRSDINHANVAEQSPSHSIGAPMQMYSQGKTQASNDAQTGTDWDILSCYQNGLGGGLAMNVDAEDLAMNARRNSSAHDVSTHLVVTKGGDTRATHYGEEMTNKQVTFEQQ